MGVFLFYYPNSSLLAILYQASSATAARHSTSFHRSPLPFRGCLSFRAFLTSVCSVCSVVALFPVFCLPWLPVVRGCFLSILAG